MVEWVRLLYTDFKIRIQHNGKFSSDIPVQRSVHQGGCMSVQIFLLCAEVIALELRQCEKIKGIPVNDIIYLLNQYADDMGISSDMDQTSIDTIFEYLEWFRKNTGFTLSYEKTSIFRIGSIRDTNAMLYTQKNVAWTSDEITVLGIKIVHNTDELISRNFDDLLHQTDTILAGWENRNLSLMGKITVVNTLIGSLFVYKMSVLPNVSTTYIKKMEQKIVDYLWGRKRPKIPLRVLKMNKKDGGLRLVDLEHKQASLKISWLATLAADTKLANLVYSFIAPVLGEDIWRCNFKPSHVDRIFDVNRNQFWGQVMVAWARINYKSKENDIPGAHFLWFNSEILIDGQMVFIQRAYLCGVQKGWYINAVHGKQN